MFPLDGAFVVSVPLLTWCAVNETSLSPVFLTVYVIVRIVDEFTVHARTSRICPKIGRSSLPEISISCRVSFRIFQTAAPCPGAADMS